MNGGKVQHLGQEKSAKFLNAEYIKDHKLLNLFLNPLGRLLKLSFRQ